MNKPTSPYTCCLCGSKQNKIFRKLGFVYCRCMRCRLVSTYPIPKKTAIKIHYQNKFINGNYRHIMNYSNEYKRVYSEIINSLEKYLEQKKQKLKNMSVLDVGCFTGDFLFLLKQRGADVWGIELQKKAVQIANKKLPGRIFLADLMDYKYPSKKYDIITLLGVLEHVTNPHLLLYQCSRLISNNGVLVLQTPNSESMPALILKKYWPAYQPVEHIHLFSKRTLLWELKHLNFGEILIMRHWKLLPINYVYHMLEYFGNHFYKLFKPIYNFLPHNIKNMSLRFYGGEILLLASKLPE